MTASLLEEVEHMRRVPGVIFTDSATGRRAEVAGVGLAVWEVIMIYRQAGENWHALKASLYWWSDEQLNAALEYARLYPEEIYPRVEAAESFDIEEFWREHPATRPRDAGR